LHIVHKDQCKETEQEHGQVFQIIAVNMFSEYQEYPSLSF
jgi:hypothetical protein